MKYIALIVASQVNILVQGKNAEAYDFPAEMARECQEMADAKGLPVVWLGRESGERLHYKPNKKAKSPAMRADVYSISLTVGPTTCPKGLKGPALTMRPSCPLYDEEDWTDRDGNPSMMIDSSDLGKSYDDFLRFVCKETGLDVTEYDTYYVLSFVVNITNKTNVQQVIGKLEKFVDKHFTSFVPVKDGVKKIVENFNGKKS